MSPTRELPVIERWFDLMAWAMPVVGRLPRSHRYTLGTRVETALLNVLEQLLRARFGREKAAPLAEANLQLDLVRYQVRLMHESRIISHGDYGGFCERLLEIGRQIGGWGRADAAGR